LFEPPNISKATSSRISQCQIPIAPIGVSSL
jgi:hypothetical protein